jgi:NAD(P)-dependent dehydrogenase (short-subunit alcohol dehydrogenase family)
VAGKAAIVTGAASGIGRATAELLAREGASVCVADVDADRGQQVVDGIAAAGGAAIFVRTDVGVSADVGGMIERTEAAFGRLDIIHNNAIWFRMGAATELDEADWDGTLNVGLKAVFLAAKHGIPVMRKTGGGAIINTASVQGLQSQPLVPAYAASKGGVLSLTRNMALDYAAENIRVLAVCPGAIDTKMVRTAATLEEGDPDDIIAEWGRSHPIGRIGQGVDIANVVLFLASDKASFMTGEHVNVDGGYMALGAWAGAAGAAAVEE